MLAWPLSASAQCVRGTLVFPAPNQPPAFFVCQGASDLSGLSPSSGDTAIIVSDGSFRIYNGAWVNPNSGGSTVPSGANIFLDSGSCPAGYTENSALSGKTLIGTTAAAGNVGTTGGSDTITPTGTNSAPSFTGTAWTPPAIAWPAGVPTHSGTAASFSGNALGTHAHELPLHGGTTPRITAGYGTGASIAGTRALTNTAQTTSQAVLLSQAISAGTPAGTVTITNQGSIAWPAGVPTIGAYTPLGSVSAPTFTGNQFDNRSAFTRVIVCKKN